MRKLLTSLIVLALIISFSAPFPVNAASRKQAAKLSPGEHMIKYARKYLGSKYVRAGTYLKDLDDKHDINRVDCTGFVRGIYKRYANIELPGGNHRRMLKKSLKLGKKIGRGKKGLAKAKAGDILFFHTGTRRQHVGLYYKKKNGKHYIIEANSVARGVTIRRLRRPPKTVVRLENKIKEKSKRYSDYLKTFEAH